MDYTLILIIYCSYLVFLSVITFSLYGNDKSRAIKNKDRIKEKTLLGMSSIGGSVGAVFGSVIFHHKTDKSYFNLVNFFSLLLQLCVLGALIYFVFVMKAGVR